MAADSLPANQACAYRLSVDSVRTVMVLLCLLLVPGLSPADTQIDQSVYDAAIEQAREGNFDDALNSLGKLQQANPDNPRLLHDQVRVLLWAGRESEALDLLPRIDSYQAPVKVVEAMARIARNSASYGVALEYYRQLLERDSASREARLGHALTLSDSGDPPAALLQLQDLLRDYPGDKVILMALVYVSEAAGDTVWLAEYLRQLAVLDPENAEILNRQVRVLRDLGAPDRALQAAARAPQKVDAERLRAIRIDSAAARIRWGQITGSSTAPEYSDSLKALQMLDEVCACDWETLDLSVSINRRMVLDRMLVLRDRQQMQPVLDYYQRLQQAGASIPPYALLAAGDASLYLQQPEQALQLYEQVLALDENSYNARQSKFYALVELGRHDEADAVIRQLALEQPVWRSRWGGRTIRDNPRRLGADLTAVMGLAYAGQLEQADMALADMQALAPANTVISRNHATVWLWRGWHRRAADSYERILRYEPEFTAARVGLAAARLSLRDYAYSAEHIPALEQEFPRQLDVQKLARRWDMHQRPQLLATARRGKSTGGALGSRDANAGLRLYSVPLADNYRVFLDSRYSDARFAEGFGTTLSPGIGLEYRDPEWVLSGLVSKGLKDNDEAALAFEAGWQPDDFWRFTSALEFNTVQMPLRGQRVGVQANRFALGTAYVWHESQRVDLSYALVDMDDGNLRQSLSAALERRLLNLSDYSLTGRVEAFTSDNSEQGVVYFNPERDASLSFNLDNRWQLYRRYELSFSHRVGVGIGRYWQQGAGTAPIWSLTYEQALAISERLQLVYGLTRRERSYDGASEYQTDYYGNLNMRF